MERRAINFQLWLTTNERALIKALAQQFDRTDSDLVRWLVRVKARELGLLSGSPAEQLPEVKSQ